jgi:anti-anti-sigma factor
VLFSIGGTDRTRKNGSSNRFFRYDQPQGPIMSAIRSLTNNGVRVVYVPDVRLTETSRIESLASEIDAIVNRTEVNRLLINFSNVSFMASAMFGKLIFLNKLCRERKVQLKLCGLNDELMAIIHQMKLDKYLSIHATEEDALEQFAGKKKGWFSWVTGS